MNGESEYRQLSREGRTGYERGRSRRTFSAAHYILIIAFAAIILIAAPASAAGANVSGTAAGTVPQMVNVTVYVVDFNRFDVEAGTVGIDYYLDLKSDSPVSIDDVELMNGMISSVSPGLDTPDEKEYRIVAVLKTDTDLSRYPFDRDTLTLMMEPKLENEREMVFSINPAQSRLDRDAKLPGWEFTGTGSAVTNHSYIPGEVPYSRVVFSYGIAREITSTILKFFLPIMLIIVVSLSSLMMKTSSRLGLNASMFLAAVLIHWRISDSIPAVTYATFLDLFMIITYATLVMVLLSGILILKFSESGNTVNIERVNYWSIRVIPPLTISLYFLLFLTLLV